MKSCDKRNLLVILFIVLSTNLGCQKRGDLAPFFDGLYFKYNNILNTGNTYTIYTIKKVDSEYNVIEERLTPVFPETINHIVDLYGFIKKSTKIKETSKETKDLKFNKGRRIAFWIPPKELQINKRFSTSLSGRSTCRVIEKKSWNKWSVLVSEDEVGAEFYYDIKTGFLVGCHVSIPLVGSRKTILIETNADIPY